MPAPSVLGPYVVRFVRGDAGCADAPAASSGRRVFGGEGAPRTASFLDEGHAFSDADLEGSFTFAFDDIGWKSPIPDLSAHVGFVTLDGLGHVTGGRRILSRQEDWGNGEDLESNLRRFVQTASGTYAVAADGTGTLSVTWSPALPPAPMHGNGYPCLRMTRGSHETFDIAVSGGGFRSVAAVPYQVSCTCAPGNCTDGEPMAPGFHSVDFARRSAPCALSAPAFESAKTPLLRAR
jgi:hypothetical protein